ncbi:hypothetical protein Pmani_010925 [Petrolisthes manimaculis]|uniref:Uncharacterized protein n=1 Tax=Petrolisthes manimaculis TaxID=1843537 RepID=A0AAE1UG71_9EUCA|nr:hypothetical protein Pmani_010925 [Petrolisthes manimaculis]
MKTLVFVLVVVVAVVGAVPSNWEYKSEEEGESDAQPYEPRSHRELTDEFGFEDGFGELDQPADESGFFKGNSLPRPSGLASLPGFSEPVSSGGFEPIPAVGGPSPFSIPELKEAPIQFLTFPFTTTPTTQSLLSSHHIQALPHHNAILSPSALPHSPSSSSSSSFCCLPDDPVQPPPAARPSTKPQGSSKGKPTGDKLRNPRKRRPQKYRERESSEVLGQDDAPLARPPVGRLRQRGKNTNNSNNNYAGVGQDREGVTGFINAFRRLIQRVM